MVVAASVSHPLASKAVLLPSDLDGQDFIGFDEDLSIRRELDRFFHEHRIEIHLTMQFDNIQIAYHMDPTLYVDGATAAAENPAYVPAPGAFSLNPANTEAHVRVNITRHFADRI